MVGQSMEDNDKPHMSMVNGRPGNVLHRLHSDDAKHVYVQCRLPNGTDAFVPLRMIYELFEKELIAKVRQSSGEMGI
jgi:hypothetical protein